MPWKTTISATCPFIETRYTGIVARCDLFDSAKETIALAVEHGIDRLLADFTASEGGHSFADISELAETVVPRSSIQKMKQALLMSSD
jgi:hypothetical protein